MEATTATTNRSTTKQVELYDDEGRLIGVIARPVVVDVLGPGREKVYLSRPAGRRRITSHAA